MNLMYTSDFNVDEDLQGHDFNMLQLDESKADLPYDADLVEKLDPVDRYVNDLSI